MRQSEVDIRPEDFLIRIRPFLDEEGKWDGELDISIVTQPNEDIDDEDYHQLLHFCKMVASSVPIMEHNEQIRNIVHDYVLEVVDKEMEYEVELEDTQEVVKTYDGNVVHLNFNSTTKGSA